MNLQGVCSMKILIAYSKSKAGVLDRLASLCAYLDSIDVEHESLDADALISQDVFDEIDKPACVSDGSLELAITLGGDGTILRTAKILEGKNIPILGVNLGNLGFLANDVDDNLIELVSSALAGELTQEERTNISCDIVCEGESDWVSGDGEQMRPSLFALNEIAVTRGDMGVMIDMYLDIASAKIGRFRGDGMIVATATGSTAYSLAAGGPIVAPSFHGLIVQPLASHTISARTVLTNENDVVAIDIPSVSGEAQKRNPTVYVDGVRACLETPVKTVYVRRGSVPTKLLYRDANTTMQKATETFFRGI